jgi:hypothetical protein
MRRRRPVILAELEDEAEAEPGPETDAVESAFASISSRPLTAAVEVAVADEIDSTMVLSSSGVAVGLLASSSATLPFSRATLAEDCGVFGVSQGGRRAGGSEPQCIAGHRVGRRADQVTVIFVVTTIEIVCNLCFLQLVALQGNLGRGLWCVWDVSKGEGGQAEVSLSALQVILGRSGQTN